MSTETAQAVLIASAGIGIVVWLIALRFLLVTSRMARMVAASPTEELGSFEQRAENRLFGSADVEGEPSALMEKALGLLAKMSALGPGSLGPLKIVERTNDRVVFEGTGLGSAGQGFRQGIL